MGVTIPPLFYFYGIERDQAIAFCTAANDALADYCAAAPKRFFFMPSLPLQDIEASIVEVRRAAARGARGINMGGRNLAGKRSEEHTSELQSLMRISYAVFCLNKKKETT